MKLHAHKFVPRTAYSIYFAMVFCLFFKWPFEDIVNRIKMTTAAWVGGQMTTCTVIPYVLQHFLIKDPVGPFGCASIFAFEKSL